VAPTRIWPGSDDEWADRHAVVRLIEQVGRDRLRFTVADLRSHLKASRSVDGIGGRAAALHRPRDLSRHVAAIEKTGTLLVQIGTQFDAGGTAPSTPRSRHVFVLSCRQHEWLAGVAVSDMDDVERVHLALWVAFIVAGARPVTTSAVTHVLRNVRQLAIGARRQTAAMLQGLAARAAPLAEQIRMPGERWTRWQPSGPEPLLAQLDEWVRQARAASGSSAVLSGAGHATANEVARSLIEIAVTRFKSRDWPSGRSVTMNDISAVIGADCGARELSDHLKRVGSPLRAVLGDATKENVAGAPRVHQRIVKVPNSWTSATYYDVPDVPGYEARRMVVQMRGLAAVLAPTALNDLMFEHAKAITLGRDASHPALTAMSAVRLLHLQHHLDVLGEALREAQSRAHLLGSVQRGHLNDLVASYMGCRKATGTTAEALSKASDALRVFDLGADEILAADRPLLTAVEYAAFFPERALGERTPAEFLALARSLRRYPNPRYVHRHDADPVLAAPTAVDRVDALVYAAQRGRSPLAAFLASGAGLLGTFLRDPRLPAAMLEAPAAHERNRALAALALLGDERAGNVAEDVLAGRTRSTRPLEAVYALLVLRKFRADKVPVSLRHSVDVHALRAIVAAERAVSRGAWLLQS
jgi:hypothetical protein